MSVPITPLDDWISRKIGASGPLGREALEAYQLAAAQRALRFAAEQSPFYRRRLRGVRLDAVEGVSDLSQVPFTTADDLREHGLDMVCVSQGEIERIVTLASSGSTGPPKRVYFTSEDQELTVDFFHHGMATLVEPGQRVLVLMPGSRPGTVGDLLVKALARHGVEAFVHGFVQDPAAVFHEVRAKGIDCLVAVPVQALVLGRWGRCAVAKGRIQSVLLSADHVPDPVAAAVEQAFGCRVYQHYGMTEMGLGGGVECRAFAGYHCREADLLFEVVEPASGKQLPDGEEGEIVFTTLTRRGMPLIRYRTGDLGRFIPEPCRCGTALRRLDRIRARVLGSVRLAGGVRLVLADLDDALFRIGGVLDFTASVTDEDGSELLDLKLRTRPESIESTLDAARDALAVLPLLRRSRESGGLTVRVSAEGAGTKEAPYAKRAIQDLREVGGS